MITNSIFLQCNKSLSNWISVMIRKIMQRMGRRQLRWQSPRNAKNVVRGTNSSSWTSTCLWWTDTRLPKKSQKWFPVGSYNLWWLLVQLLIKWIKNWSKNVFNLAWLMWLVNLFLERKLRMYWRSTWSFDYGVSASFYLLGF